MRGLEKGRWKVELVGGLVKWVKRLCLRFKNENRTNWANRIQTAKLKRQQAALQNKFFRYIDSVDSEELAPMSRATKESFVNTGVRILLPPRFKQNPKSEHYIDVSASGNGRDEEVYDTVVNYQIGFPIVLVRG